MATEKIRQNEELEKQFRRWANKVDTIKSQDTINTYWNQIKKIPDFDLRDIPDDDPEEEEDNRDTISGLIDRHIESEHQLQAVRRLLDCKLHYIKKDDSIPHLEYMRIKIRTQEILESISVDEADVEKKYDKIKKHYIRKDDMVELLRRAPPMRAKYWACTYLLGVRWFASKTLTDNLLFQHRGDHGMVRIPEERTKSKKTRDIYLYSDWFWQIIDSVPQGDWEDRHGTTWKEVYFPDRNQDKENYQLGRKKNGKVYGLVGEIGLSPRTMHSFRHTRITDLLKAEEKSLTEVQDRSGHSETSSTNHYKEVSFDRDPQSLEQYCRENNIDLIEVLNQSP